MERRGSGKEPVDASRPAFRLTGTTGPLPRLPSMRIEGLGKRNARRIVAARLRAFFAALKDQLSAGNEELWKRAEGKLSSTTSQGKTNEGGQDGR